MEDAAEFNDIYISSKHRSKGRLRIESDKVKWESQYSGNSVTIPSNSVSALLWMPIGQSFQLTLLRRGGTSTRFQGFDAAALEAWQKFGATCGRQVERIDRSSKGWNWGEVDMGPSTIQFTVDGKQAFDLPYADIAHCSTQGQNEVVVEFHQDDTARAEDEDLVELRLFVPNQRMVHKEDGADEENDTHTANALCNSILSRSNLGAGSEESIASFSNVHMLVPRGRYEVEMFSSHFVLYGKTYTFKIFYKSISNLFLLQKPSNQLVFVVHLDPAIRQGSTLYSFLLMQFEESQEMELAPNLDAKIIREQYAGELSEHMEGSAYDIVTRMFRAFSKKKIIASGSFKSVANEYTIHCSFKANDGLLFPLDKGLFFIHKPPLFLRYDDVTSVEFARMDTGGTKSRTFDLVINVRSGDTASIFSSIPRDEYTQLFEFLKSKDVHIINAKALSQKRQIESTSMSGRKRRVLQSTTLDAEEEAAAQLAEDDEEEEDEDFASAKSSSSDSEEYDSKSEPSGSDREAATGEAGSKKSGDEESEAGDDEEEHDEEDIDEKE